MWNQFRKCDNVSLDGDLQPRPFLRLQSRNQQILGKKWRYLSQQLKVMDRGEGGGGGGGMPPTF